MPQALTSQQEVKVTDIPASDTDDALSASCRGDDEGVAASPEDTNTSASEDSSIPSPRNATFTVSEDDNSFEGGQSFALSEREEGVSSGMLLKTTPQEGNEAVRKITSQQQQQMQNQQSAAPPSNLAYPVVGASGDQRQAASSSSTRQSEERFIYNEGELLQA